MKLDNLKLCLDMQHERSRNMLYYFRILIIKGSMVRLVGTGNVI